MTSGRSPLVLGIKNAVIYGIMVGTQTALCSARSSIWSSGTPRWYSHSSVISLPVHSFIGFLIKSPGTSVNKPYTHTQTLSLSCSLNCPWRLIVQLNSQLESLQLTIPPVTVFPLRGSRWQIFSIYGRILSSNVVTVADSQLVFVISEQNFSGCPNAGSCFAMFFHRLQQPLVRTSASPFGAWFWSP